MYEIWSLDTGKILHAVEVNLAADRISWSPAYSTLASPDNINIQVTAAISADVRTAVIGNVIASIVEQRWDNNDPGGAECLALYQELPGKPERLWTPFRRDMEYTADLFRNNPKAKFSPTGDYLVTVHYSVDEVCKGTELCPTRWLAQVLQNNRGTPNSLHYVPVASTEFFGDLDISLCTSLEGVEFHPTEPILFIPQVYNGLSQTYAWFFERPADILNQPSTLWNPHPLCYPPLIDIRFSPDGRHISGTTAEGEFEFASLLTPSSSKPAGLLLDQASRIDGAIPILSKAARAPSDVSSSPTNPSLDMARRIAAEKKPIVQSQSSVIVNKLPQGHVEMSRLMTLESNHSATLYCFASTGIGKEETLTRIPEEMKDRVSVDVINHPHNPRDDLRLVLNKPLQRKYIVNNDSLPAVLDRAWSTVPVKTKRITSKSKSLPDFSFQNVDNNNQLLLDIGFLVPTSVQELADQAPQSTNSCPIPDPEGEPVDMMPRKA
ncbi:hypothetical protein BJX62DRAFT_241389 [Aspergillus germanicus]